MIACGLLGKALIWAPLALPFRTLACARLARRSPEGLAWDFHSLEFHGKTSVEVRLLVPLAGRIDHPVHIIKSHKAHNRDGSRNGERRVEQTTCAAPCGWPAPVSSGLLCPTPACGDRLVTAELGGLGLWTTTAPERPSPAPNSCQTPATVGLACRQSRWPKLSHFGWDITVAPPYTRGLGNNQSERLHPEFGLLGVSRNS
jgi:hypothetical protein